MYQYKCCIHNVLSYIQYLTQITLFEEFYDFSAQADMDICVDALGFSSQFGAEESRQEFRTDSCGKWPKPVTYGRSVACKAEPALLTASLIYV